MNDEFDLVYGPWTRVDNSIFCGVGGLLTVDGHKARFCSRIYYTHK